jgi:hypothetical protein
MNACFYLTFITGGAPTGVIQLVGWRPLDQVISLLSEGCFTYNLSFFIKMLSASLYARWLFGFIESKDHSVYVSVGYELLQLQLLILMCTHLIVTDINETSHNGIFILL